MIVPSRRWFVGAAALAALALVALVWPPAASVLVVVDVLWLAALVFDVVSLMGKPFDQILVEREPPPAFSVGRPLPVVYRWENRDNRAAVLRVREDLPEHLTQPGGADRTLVIPASRDLVETTLTRPVRRGRHTAGRFHLRRLGRLGLAWRQTRRDQPWTATVFPNLVGVSLRSLPTQAQRRREAGMRAVRSLGQGRVFESLREWVPGDDSRAIDWKATGRRGKVMTRQYEDERRQILLLVIDAGRLLTAEIDGVPRLEAVIDAALHLAYSAVDRDDNVGLMVFTDKVDHFVPPARGRRALKAVLDTLAVIEGKLVEPNYPLAFSYLAARNGRRALTVVFTDVVDRTASEALVAQVGSLRPRHLPVAVTLRNPALEQLATARPKTGLAAYERAAAEELLQSRDAALADIRKRGVLVLDVAPQAASAAVVELYNRLKRQGAV
ncbi:MAG: DUF58 domain-containing protein [Gemmatimonadota bacterium]